METEPLDVQVLSFKFSCYFDFQGRFSINLQDTGIKLTSKVMWGSTGQAYSQIIYRYPVGMITAVGTQQRNSLALFR